MQKLETKLKTEAFRRKTTVKFETQKKKKHRKMMKKTYRPESPQRQSLILVALKLLTVSDREEEPRPVSRREACVCVDIPISRQLASVLTYLTPS